MTKQGNMPHNQEVNQLTETVPQMKDMIELADNDLTTAIIRFKDSKENKYNEMRNGRCKKNQIQFLEVKKN